MTARPNASNAGPPDRPRHAPSDLRRARPVRPAPPPPEEADAVVGEDQARDHNDEVDLQRRLQRRRRGNLPVLLIAGVGALALAGGLIVFTSGQDETKPAPLTGQQEVAAVPAPDSRDAESTSGPARAGLPPEPARNAASSSAPTPDPPAAKPPEQDRAAQPEPPSGRADFAPSTPGPSAAPSAEVAGLLRRARELIDVGDIGAARLLLERAAATNDGSAPFALAETYDPAALARWRVQGVRPNVDRARMLYQRALDRGVGQAQERLAGLR